MSCFGAVFFTAHVQVVTTLHDHKQRQGSEQNKSYNQLPHSKAPLQHIKQKPSKEGFCLMARGRKSPGH
jgi:hypothetical protein